MTGDTHGIILGFLNVYVKVIKFLFIFRLYNNRMCPLLNAPMTGRGVQHNRKKSRSASYLFNSFFAVNNTEHEIMYDKNKPINNIK